MLSFLHKKIGIPESARPLHCVEWTGIDGWIVCGSSSVSGAMKALKLEEATSLRLARNQQLDTKGRGKVVALMSFLKQTAAGPLLALDVMASTGTLLRWQCDPQSEEWKLHSEMQLDVGCDGDEVLCAKWSPNRDAMCLTANSGKLTIIQELMAQTTVANSYNKFTIVEWLDNSHVIALDTDNVQRGGSGTLQILTVNSTSKTVQLSTANALLKDSDSQVAAIAVRRKPNSALTSSRTALDSGSFEVTESDNCCVCICLRNGRIIMCVGIQPANGSVKRCVTFNTMFDVPLSHTRWNANVLAVVCGRHMEFFRVDCEQMTAESLSVMSVPSQMGPISDIDSQQSACKWALTVATHVYFAVLKPKSRAERYQATGQCTFALFCDSRFLALSVNDNPATVHFVDTFDSLLGETELNVTDTATLGSNVTTLFASHSGAEVYALTADNSLHVFNAKGALKARVSLKFGTSEQKIKSETEDACRSRTLPIAVCASKKGPFLVDNTTHKLLFYDSALVDCRCFKLDHCESVRSLCATNDGSQVCVNFGSFVTLLKENDASELEEMLKIDGVGTAVIYEALLNCDGSKIAMIDSEQCRVVGATATDAGDLLQQRRDAWCVQWSDTAPDTWCFLEKSKCFLFTDGSVQPNVKVDMCTSVEPLHLWGADSLLCFDSVALTTFRTDLHAAVGELKKGSTELGVVIDSLKATVPQSAVSATVWKRVALECIVQQQLALAEYCYAKAKCLRGLKAVKRISETADANIDEVLTECCLIPSTVASAEHITSFCSETEWTLSIRKYLRAPKPSVAIAKKALEAAVLSTDTASLQSVARKIATQSPSLIETAARYCVELGLLQEYVECVRRLPGVDFVDACLKHDCYFALVKSKSATTTARIERKLQSQRTPVWERIWVWREYEAFDTAAKLLKREAVKAIAAEKWTDAKKCLVLYAMAAIRDMDCSGAVESVGEDVDDEFHRVDRLLRDGRTKTEMWTPAACIHLWMKALAFAQTGDKLKALSVLNHLSTSPFRSFLTESKLIETVYGALVTFAVEFGHLETCAPTLSHLTRLSPAKWKQVAVELFESGEQSAAKCHKLKAAKSVCLSSAVDVDGAKDKCVKCTQCSKYTLESEIRSLLLRTCPLCHANF